MILLIMLMILVVDVDDKDDDIDGVVDDYADLDGKYVAIDVVVNNDGRGEAVGDVADNNYVNDDGDDDTIDNVGCSVDVDDKGNEFKIKITLNNQRFGTTMVSLSRSYEIT